MQKITRNSHAIDHLVLETFSVKLFVAAGLTEKDAKLVADTLVASSLRGVDSHGVARIPHYLKRLQQGSIKSRPKIVSQKLSVSTARVKGDHGLGQLVMHRATEAAIELANETGAGWASVGESSHCGSLAYFGLKIAEAGMIGFVFTHVDSMVIPHGAQKPFCGTNPICITAPRTSHGADQYGTGAVCLDMATSKVPWNVVVNATTEKASIELGWGVDDEGNDTTQPEEVTGLYPFGDYKGSGLGLIIDILCSLLSSSPFGPDIPVMYGDLKQRRHLGGLVGAIDIGRFVPVEHFYARMNELLERWNGLTPRKKDGLVMFPGEPELIEQENRLQNGIPIGQHVFNELDETADLYGIARLPRSIPKLGHTGPHLTQTSAGQNRQSVTESY